MRVISRHSLITFCEKYDQARKPMDNWFHKVKEADWKNFSDLKRTFRTADYVGDDRYVFNVHGNEFRIVAYIPFQFHAVYIKFVGTHLEYDRINVKTVEL